jgi:hypothetical protein
MIAKIRKKDLFLFKQFNIKSTPFLQKFHSMLRNTRREMQPRVHPIGHMVRFHNPKQHLNNFFPRPQCQAGPGMQVSGKAKECLTLMMDMKLLVLSNAGCFNNN